MDFLSASYKKSMQSQLRIAVKGRGGKQAKGVVFRQCGDWFFAGHWRAVSADPTDGLRIEIMGKPMAIDPMLWETMGLQDNLNRPLSFRYWGAFICGIPVLDHDIIDETAPNRAIPKFLDCLDNLLPGAIDLLESNKFSDLAKQSRGIHHNWRMEETIIHALRLEGEPKLALDHAERNAGAFSTCSDTNAPTKVSASHNAIVGADLRREIKQPFWNRLVARLSRK